MSSTADAALETAPPGFDHCDERVRKSPDSEEAWACYRSAGQVGGALDEVMRRIEARLAVDPALHWGRYHLGLMATDRGEARASDLLRESAEGFQRAGNQAGAALAREKLAMFLTNQERYAEAEVELERAEALADASGEVGRRATVRVQRGWTALRQGDYWSAGTHMQHGERLADSQGGRGPRQVAAGGQAAVAWLTGRLGEAASHYERQVAILREMGEIDLLSQALGNLLGISKSLVESGEMSREEMLVIAQRTLAAGEAARQPWGITRANVALAQLLDGEEARRHARAAIEVARSTGNRGMLRGVQREAGYRLVQLDPARPEEGLRAIEASLEDGRRFGNPDEEVRSRVYLAGVQMEIGSKESTVAAFEELFHAIERVRDLQPDERVRAGAFSLQALQYRRLAGYLLARDGASDEDLDQAFRTLERMRARVLLDRLDLAGAAPVPAGPLADRRDEALEAITRVQRSLSSRGLTDRDRAAALVELERLELEEGELRLQIARADPAFARPRPPEFPRTSDVVQELGDDEALLAFAASTTAAGGSWVVTIDRRGARAWPLRPVDELRPRVAFFRGLVERRDGEEAAMATTLGRELLGEALDGLADGVSRLIIVPDGVLWQVPFDALRVGDDGRLLGERYQVSLAPSATVGLRWRREESASALAPVLSLADPDLALGAGEVASERAWALERGLAFGPLPRARAEGRVLTRKLGGGSWLLLGPEASERALKEAGPGRFWILHLAAHAVVDEMRPERSAVVLAPGGPREDGLLQPREIAALDLRGRVVLLTACRGASGALFEGEGPLSLTHAFFQAGARAVVSSLWPLRDQDAADLVEALAERLAGGKSLGEALAAARRERIAAGAPAEAWAGLVLIGDGGAVPVPGGAAAAFPWNSALAGAALLVLALTLLTLRAGLRQR